MLGVFQCVATHAAVSCSADDQAAIQAIDDNAFGDQPNTCGSKALSLTRVNHNEFNSCLTSAIGINIVGGVLFVPVKAVFTPVIIQQLHVIDT